MRNPILVLKNLEEHSKDKEYRFKRLYRNLYNPEFFLLAYRNIASSQGSMTAGVDGQTLDGMSMARIDRIIGSLKDHSYQPNPVRRTYIAKKNSSKKRPLGIPSTDDKLTQEVVRMMLEAIYEPIFSENSHGFRPYRSCHTALRKVQVKFNAVRWVVEGDIKGCFDNIDHHILVELLRRRIDDEYFIALIWKFLKAGYMEKWEYSKTYSGTPQGSGASPVLANVYLHELDVFMDEYKKKFDKQESYRKYSVEYSRVNGKLSYWKQKIKIAKETGDTAELERANLKEKELYKILRSTPCFPAIDPTYKKIQYNRYADDFVIGIIGSKKDAKQVKEDVGSFLKEKLNLVMSEEKTKITHSSERIRYLGYDFAVSRSMDSTRDKNGVLVRRWNGQVKLYVPTEKWVSKLKELGAMFIRKHADGKEEWHPTYRGKLINMPDAQIVSKYNSEVRGLYNFYRIANNVSILNNFNAVMRRSLYKTFAAKYQTTYKHIVKRYRKNGVFTVFYGTKSGMKKIEYYNQGFRKMDKPAPTFADELPSYRKHEKPNNLANRMKRGICELCGRKTDETVVHHVRKLKELKGQNEWELKMLEIRRKSLMLCQQCFDLIE